MYTLQVCNDSMVCDTSSSDGTFTCLQSYVKPFRYPGEVCNASQDCFNGVCNETAHLCQGKPEASSCANDNECNPSLYCDKTVNQCVKTIAPGQACNPGKCDAFHVCSNNVCVLMGSLKNGVSATAPAACESFYVNTTNFCADGPTFVQSKSKLPYQCETACEYKLESGSVFEPCACGRDSNGTKFCNPGRGDLKMTDVSFCIHS